ncbi:MAG: T9SS type A sorting domain-containing protein, partial [Saprospiraceae bacterium]|nr:T9SS type A sorting domain-containing protein [Saprospiraceae bacterium]
YCSASTLMPDNAALEWISAVALSDMVQSSGAEGYGDFTGEAGINLKRNDSYDMTVTPGFSSAASNQYMLAWIDFNQDGMFTSNEVVFDSEGTTQQAVTRSITIPQDAILGSTRMRVVMQFRSKPGACTFPTGFFGEVEDYCVTIDEVTRIFQPEPLPTQLILAPNPAKDHFSISYTLNQSIQSLRLDIVDLSGHRIWQENLGYARTGKHTQTIFTDQWPQGVYMVRLIGDGRLTTKRLVIFDN